MNTLLGTDFKLPVYLVQGTEDLLTTQAVTQRYYDAIKAPVKKLALCRAPATIRICRWSRPRRAC